MSTMSANASSEEAVQVRSGLLRFSMMHFLVALVLLLFTSPFLEDLGYGRLIERILMSIVLLTAVLAVGGRHRMLAFGIALVIPALASRWLTHFVPTPATHGIAAASSMAFVLFVITQLMRFVLRARHVNREVLCGGLAGYLMLALLFATAYSFVAILNPDAFARTPPWPPGHALVGFESLYFSFTTLSTVGYGDILPVSNVARMLAMAEAISGTFYMTVLIARLVSLYSSRPPVEVE